MKNGNFFGLLVFVFALSLNTVFADATSSFSTSTATIAPICLSLNSLIIYSKNNVKTIQSFLKDKYFSKIKVTGIWDLQTKNYIKNFQFSYGLNPTGKLNEETLTTLKGIGHCYILETAILNYQRSSSTLATTSATSTASSTNIFTKAKAILTTAAGQNFVLVNLIKDLGIDTRAPVVGPAAPDYIPQFTLNITNASDYKYIYSSLNKTNEIKDLEQNLAKRIYFNSDLSADFENCNDAQEYFDSSNNKIVICYGYLDFLIQNNHANISVDDKVNQAANFVFLHQFAHALIYDFKMPTTGSEESAADELTMYLLINYATQPEIDSTLDGIKQYYFLATNGDLNQKYFKDIHAPNLERYYNLLAFYVGSNPNQSSKFVGKEGWQLSEAQSENIDTNYSKKISNWQQLLTGHTK